MGDGRHPTEELRVDRLTEHRLNELEKGRDEDRRLATERHDTQMAAMTEIRLAVRDIVGELKACATHRQEIDTHLEHTDVDVVSNRNAIEALRAESAKSDPKSLWTGITAAATAIGALWVALTSSGDSKVHHPERADRPDRTEQPAESHK